MGTTKKKAEHTQIRAMRARLGKGRKSSTGSKAAELEAAASALKRPLLTANAIAPALSAFAAGNTLVMDGPGNSLLLDRIVPSDVGAVAEDPTALALDAALSAFSPQNPLITLPGFNPRDLWYPSLSSTLDTVFSTPQGPQPLDCDTRSVLVGAPGVTAYAPPPPSAILPSSIPVPIEGALHPKTTLASSLEVPPSGEVDPAMLRGPNRWSEATYINCDVRFFNFGRLGKFDLVYVDPPWRIKGNQARPDDGHIFSNSHQRHEYTTLSNTDIFDLDIGDLCDTGLIFLWTVASQLKVALQCMENWGFSFVDKITWARLTSNGNVSTGLGYYLLHSTEMCLIGSKSAPGSVLEFVPKVTNDLLFARVRGPSQKPVEMYQIMEAMMPGARKIELFARNNNLRRGWFALGNHLGPNFDNPKDPIACTTCHALVPLGAPAFKSRSIPNHTVCAPCLPPGLSEDDVHKTYCKLPNTEPFCVLHTNYACDGCGANPICGTRFSCTLCLQDLCSSCFDKTLASSTSPSESPCSHVMEAHSRLDPSAGLPKHHARCTSCFASPILGYRFFCTECGSLDLCQKCFFLRKEPRRHLSTHVMGMRDVCKCPQCDADPPPPPPPPTLPTTMPTK